MLENGINGPGEFRAARDLLTRRHPQLGEASGETLLLEGEGVEDAARRLAGSIDESYLAVQGPPGSGKSTVGAEMIVDLAMQGKKIGVTANSHKVIGELLAKAAANAEKRGGVVRIGQLSSRAEPTFSDAIHLKTKR